MAGRSSHSDRFRDIRRCVSEPVLHCFSWITCYQSVGWRCRFARVYFKHLPNFRQYALVPNVDHSENQRCEIRRRVHSRQLHRDGLKWRKRDGNCDVMRLHPPWQTIGCSWPHSTSVNMTFLAVMSIAIDAIQLALYRFFICWNQHDSVPLFNKSRERCSL